MLNFKEGTRILYLSTSKNIEGLIIAVSDTHTLISWAGGTVYWYRNEDRWLSENTVALCGVDAKD
jgi:hypothetical protein